MKPSDLDATLASLRKKAFSKGDDDYSHYNTKDQGSLAKLETRCNFPKLAFDLINDPKNRDEKAVIIQAINEWENKNSSKNQYLTKDMLKPYLAAAREELAEEKSVSQNAKSMNAKPISKSQKTATSADAKQAQEAGTAKEILKLAMETVSSIESTSIQMKELAELIVKSSKKTSVFSRSPKYSDYQDNMEKLFELTNSIELLLIRAFNFNHVTSTNKLLASFPLGSKQPNGAAVTGSEVRNQFISTALADTMQRCFPPSDNVSVFIKAYVDYNKSDPADKQQSLANLLAAVSCLPSVTENFLVKRSQNTDCKSAADALQAASSKVNTAVQHLNQTVDNSIDNHHTMHR